MNMHDRRFRVGLTGGIASGKTTVADRFGALGAALIDTDLIARDVVAPGTTGLHGVVQAFGDAVLAADGSLDRRALRERIFADEASRMTLEAILHPLIRAETARQMMTVEGPYQIIIVPLLVESPLRQYVDRILVVDCSTDTQLARLLARDAENSDQARRMIDAQASREQRLGIADDVIDNDGGLSMALDQVDRLHANYLQRALDKANAS